MNWVTLLFLSAEDVADALRARVVLVDEAASPVLVVSTFPELLLFEDKLCVFLTAIFLKRIK